MADVNKTDKNKVDANRADANREDANMADANKTDVNKSDVNSAGEGQKAIEQKAIEQKVIEQFAEQMQEIPVPDSLQPEQIEKLLGEKYQQKKKPWWKKKRIYGGLAAAIVLVAGLGIYRIESNETKPVIVTKDIQTAKSYEEIYNCIQKYQKEVMTTTSNARTALFGSESDPMAINESATMEESVADTASNAGTKSETNASDTNVRTEGVGEADIVKTDGTYLYVEKESAMEISIVDASTDKMKEVSTIKTENGAQISEFYVKDNKVFLFTMNSLTETDTDGYEVYKGTSTCVETYDISDKTAPKHMGTVSQSGYYNTSRIVGDYIYTFSKYDVYSENGRDAVTEYVPVVCGDTLKSDCIYMPDVPSFQYVVVTSMNVNAPENIVDQKAVLMDFGELYVSSENIYIYETVSNIALLRADGMWQQGDSSQTEIRKLSYKDGKITGEAKGVIEGYIHDSFCIDEYEGNLRIVTTINGANATTNSVFVLDENLDQIGEINGIAQDERVYSARFFGETGYFVTYRETDPLFSVDFSDPTNPKIIGKLKIPGFSEYLHFYGENQLVGIGMDTDEETGITNGVKISMFDISDPSDVKEVHTYTIEDMYSTDLFWDYKAVLVDEEKNMIGFSCYGNREMYYIFSYDENGGFEVKMEEEVPGDSYMSTRGVYIDDRFYVVKGKTIESYRMGSFEKIDDIIL